MDIDLYEYKTTLKEFDKDFIKIGEYLFDKFGNHQEKVLADGTILYEKEAGSIHSVSAKILKKMNNNGWTFWCVARKGILKSINDLRYKYVKQYIEN
ncbi:MAG: hypothetical protein Q8P57_01250 [Candidatus Pacearchaeota archaeon]|nr:hypothetical protein [Candidatus Pacearchaeota archaeon]